MFEKVNIQDLKFNPLMKLVIIGYLFQLKRWSC